MFAPPTTRSVSRSKKTVSNTSEVVPKLKKEKSSRASLKKEKKNKALFQTNGNNYVQTPKKDQKKLNMSMDQS